MLKRLVLSAVMLVLVGVNPTAVVAKPPMDKDDGKTLFFFGIWHPEYEEVSAFVEKYTDEYPKSPKLKKLCWDPDRIRIEKYKGNFFAGIACDLDADAVSEMERILGMLKSPNMYVSASQTCTAKCSKLDGANCTKYLCPGSSQPQCFHYLMPCTSHSCPN